MFDIELKKAKMMRVMRQMPNWKPLGPDNVQGYRLENFSPLREKLLVRLQDCLGSVMALTG